MNTQKHLLTVIIIFASALVSNAQQPGAVTSAPGPAPTTLKEYVSADGRFKVLFPDTPKEINEILEFPVGKLPFHLLVCPAPVTYSVGYMNYPANLENADLVKNVLDHAREGSLAQLAKENPRVIKESDISLDGHPGRLLQIELKSDAVVRIRYLVAGNRLYVLAVGSPKEPPKVVDASNDYETMATRFLDSFKIIPALKADMSTTWKDFSSTDGRFKVQFPGIPEQSSVPAGTSGLVQIASDQSAAVYSAMYLDYPETPKDLVATIELLDDLRLGEIKSLVNAGTKPKVISESTISLDGYPGRFLVVEISNNQIYRRKMLLVKNRIYTITATAPRDDTTSGNSYEILSLRFINSFSFSAGPVKE